MSFRGRGRGRGRGGQQHERVDPRELQLVYESSSRQEQDAVEALYKGKWGVNNTDIPLDALQRYADKLFTVGPWQDDELIKTKTELNKTKDKMDDIPLQEWRQMAKQASRAQKLVLKLREQTVELATMSWCSMYEVLCRFMLFPRLMQTPDGPQWQAVPGLTHLPHQALGDTEQPNRKACATVHLCEAPGAFISAINHYKNHTAKFLDWDWRALTLSPYFAGNDTAEMLKDDALIVQTSLNWHFGKDESGDIRRRENILSFWEHCSEWFQEQQVPGAMLVTADGSVDTQENPNEQEAMMSSLIYAQFVAAIGLLAVGGSLFLKCFAALEHSSITLLFACGSLFDKVDMHKPVSSKVNNSEAYIVCRGFRGVPSEVRDNLLKYVCEDVYEKHAMLPRSVMPESFYKSAKGCGQFFAERTRAAIEDTLSKKSMHPGQAKAVKDIQDFLATQWMQKFRVTKLSPELRLSPEEFLSGRENRVGNSAQMDFKGTLKERRMKYQDRREVQGQDSTRLIKRMREETGLEDEDLQTAKTTAPTEKESKGSRTGKKTSANGERDVDGQQGAVSNQPEAAQNGSPSQFALRPDTQRIENADNLDESGSVVAPDSEEVQYAWDICELPGLPRNILATATLKPETFLEVRKHRKRAAELIQKRDSACGLCPHVGSCLAPSPQGPYGTAFWRLAALDLQLGIQQESLSDTQALIPLFLRAASDGEVASVLSLEAYGSSAVQYVLQAHYAPHHKLDVGTCFTLDTPSAVELSKALPGMLQCVAVPGAQSLHKDSTQEAKLAAFTAESSRHVCSIAGNADVVMGDLGAIDADVPQEQQLSIWPEYNRVARRRLVWDATTALGACKPGGSVLLRIGDVLTSFTVGLLYVLFRNFRLFTIVKPFTACAASSESFALFLDRAAPIEKVEEHDDEDATDSTKHLLTVLEKMEEVEAPGAAPDEEVERPHAHLLVGPHVSDILKPDVYLSGSKAFVLYVNSRINDLEKRQARMLNQLANEESHEAPSSEVLRQVSQAAVRVLFGDGSAEDEGQPLQNEGDPAMANSEQLVANGTAEHRKADERRPAGSHLASSKHETGEEKAEGASGAQSADPGEGPADALAPAGVRRKRSIVVQDTAEAYGKNHLKRESHGAKKQSNIGPAQPDQRSSAAAPNGAKNTGVEAGALRKLQDLWASRLCGIDVERKNDIFIAWSDHIHACDNDEEAMQEGNEESPR